MWKSSVNDTLIPACLSARLSVFYARHHICYSAYTCMLSPVRPSVCPSDGKNVCNVGQYCGTKMLWRSIWSSVASTRRPWVTTLRIAQPGELCAVTQFEVSRVEALAHKRAVRKGVNLAATSALGHVTVALASAVPELDSTPINKLTDDMRSFVFDGAVRSIAPAIAILNGIRWNLHSRLGVGKLRSSLLGVKIR